MMMSGRSGSGVEVAPDGGGGLAPGYWPGMRRHGAIVCLVCIAGSFTSVAVCVIYGLVAAAVLAGSLVVLLLLMLCHGIWLVSRTL